MMQLKAMSNKKVIAAGEMIPAERKTYARIEPVIRFNVAGIKNRMARAVRQPDSQTGLVDLDSIGRELDAVMYHFPKQILVERKPPGQSNYTTISGIRQTPVRF